MLGKIAQLVEPKITWLIDILHRLGLRPNDVTLLSFFTGILSAITFLLVRETMFGNIIAGFLLLLSGMLDGLDGALARRFGQRSSFGGFLDSVLDRVCEIIVFWSILASRDINLTVGIAALSTSLMVSYSRSRAETLGAEMKGEGLAERPERILVLAASSFLNQLTIGIFLIAILSTTTLLQRIVLARKTLRDSGT